MTTRILIMLSFYLVGYILCLFTLLRFICKKEGSVNMQTLKECAKVSFISWGGCLSAWIFGIGYEVEESGEK